MRNIATIHEGRISHGGWGPNGQDLGSLRFLFDEYSSLETGDTAMAGFR